jgi:hypothetical protein
MEGDPDMQPNNGAAPERMEMAEQQRLSASGEL